MAEDYLKFLTGQQGVQNPTDPLAFNPFAEGQPTEGAATPFAEELPFRFTQFAINPSTKATAGQVGRTAVARSPFTSGQSAQELAGLRSELAAMGNPENPGDPPDINQFYKAENFDPATMEQTQQAGDFRWGMPITKLEIPRGLVLEGRSPIAMAYEWQKAKGSLTPDQLEKVGPMDTIEAYDMKAMLGDDEYAKWFGDQTYQGGKNQAAQQFYQNLSVLPTNIDPQMYSDRTLANLAKRDFSRTGMSREEMISALRTPAQQIQVGTSGDSDNPVYEWTQPPVEAAGLYGLDAQGNQLNPDAIMAGNLMIDPTGKTTGTYSNFNWDNFNADIQNDLQQQINRSNPTQRFANQWTLPVVMAGMGYGTGVGLVGAAGATGGGAAGAAAGAGAGTTTASGLAGALGMSAGTAASAVNSVSSLIAAYGASRAAEMAGLPMDHPLMIAAMAAAGGAYGAYTGGGAAAPENSGQTIEIGVGGNRNMIPTELVEASPEVQAAYHNAVVSGAESFTIPSGGAAGGGVGSSDQSSGIGSNFTQKLGAQGVQGLAGAMEDPIVTREMLDPASQAEYDTAMQGYNTQVQAYERWNQLNSLYEQKLNEFNAKAELYNKYRGLEGRQAGLLSEIKGSLASNPFYDPEENLTGIQSMFV